MNCIFYQPKCTYMYKSRSSNYVVYTHIYISYKANSSRGGTITASILAYPLANMFSPSTATFLTDGTNRLNTQLMGMCTCAFEFVYETHGRRGIGHTCNRVCTMCTFSFPRPTRNAYTLTVLSALIFSSMQPSTMKVPVCLSLSMCNVCVW